MRKAVVGKGAFLGLVMAGAAYIGIDAGITHYAERAAGHDIERVDECIAGEYLPYQSSQSVTPPKFSCNGVEVILVDSGVDFEATRSHLVDVSNEPLLPNDAAVFWLGASMVAGALAGAGLSALREL